MEDELAIIRDRLEELEAQVKFLMEERSRQIEDTIVGIAREFGTGFTSQVGLTPEDLQYIRDVTDALPLIPRAE